MVGQFKVLTSQIKKTKGHPRKLEGPEIHRISRLINTLLRHTALDVGLKMDQKGYVNVKELINFIPSKRLMITEDVILEIEKNNESDQSQR